VIRDAGCDYSAADQDYIRRLHDAEQFTTARRGEEGPGATRMESSFAI
jgi:hypothetical protein